jgi:hypothetical protein
VHGKILSMAAPAYFRPHWPVVRPAPRSSRGGATLSLRVSPPITTLTVRVSIDRSHGRASGAPSLPAWHLRSCYCGYEQAAEILSFSTRWVRIHIKTRACARSSRSALQNRSVDGFNGESARPRAPPYPRSESVCRSSHPIVARAPSFRGYPRLVATPHAPPSAGCF